MSNRRKLPRDKKARCPKCRSSTSLVRKSDYGIVCLQCSHVIAPTSREYQKGCPEDD